MANAPQWTPEAVWLGKQLIRVGGWYAANIKRDAAAAGITPQQLAAAFAAIDADVSSDGAKWFLNDGRRAYWRKFSEALSIIRPAAAPAPSQIASAAAKPKPMAAPAAPSAPLHVPAPDGGLEAHHARCLVNPHMRAQAGLAPMKAPAHVPSPAAPTQKHETSAQIFERRRREIGAGRHSNQKTSSAADGGAQLDVGKFLPSDGKKQVETSAEVIARRVREAARAR